MLGTNVENSNENNVVDGDVLGGVSGTLLMEDENIFGITG